MINARRCSNPTSILRGRASIASQCGPNAFLERHAEDFKSSSSDSPAITGPILASLGLNRAPNRGFILQMKCDAILRIKVSARIPIRL